MRYKFSVECLKWIGFRNLVEEVCFELNVRLLVKEIPAGWFRMQYLVTIEGPEYLVCRAAKAIKDSVKEYQRRTEQVANK